MEKELKQINNELKGYINEAKFISNKCRNKLLKYLGTSFSVDLPLENFANIDAEITSDGSIIMRGDLYKTTEPIKDNNELIKKYNEFKEKALVLLKKKEVNYKTRSDSKNILNLVIVGILSIVYIVIAVLIVISIIKLNFFFASILIALMTSTLIPSIKSRFEQAKNFLKRKIK